VPRPRLIERLNDALHCKLALVSAPAGFGKTALLSEWLRTRDRWTIAENRLPSAAWLSLDAEDNKLARFLSYLIATLAPIAPEVGQAAGNGVGAQVKGAGGAGVSQVDGGHHGDRDASIMPTIIRNVCQGWRANVRRATLSKVLGSQARTWFLGAVMIPRAVSRFAG
jgi:hypothetical protein